MKEGRLRKFAAIVALLAMIATVVGTGILVILDNINNPVQDDQSVNLDDLTPEQLDEFYRSIGLDPDNINIVDDDTELDEDDDSSLIKKDVDIDKLLNNPNITPATSGDDTQDYEITDDIYHSIDDESDVDDDINTEAGDDDTQDLDSIPETGDDISE